MVSNFLKSFFTFAVAVAVSIPPHSWAGRAIGELSSGSPIHMGTALAPESYVEVTAKRLAQPRVLWLNFSWLREKNIGFPSEGLTASFEHEVLEAFAWFIARPDDPAEAFLEREKTFWADRYGGAYIGMNAGSGRAASAGAIQIKGIGITPLVNPSQGFDHAHGGASIEEGIREAIWGEINNKELPYGANRVVALIDSGLFTTWPDGSREPRVLIVREDPVRPAHYLGLEGYLASDWNSRLEISDSERVAANLSLLGTPALQNFASTVGAQYATSFARSLFHGATSASNIELSGRFLDYGTQTAQPGFAPIKVLAFQDPFGKTDEIRDILVSQFAQSLGLDPKSHARIFDISFERTWRMEFLANSGLPPEIIEKIADTPAARELVAAMESVALAGTTVVTFDKELPNNLSQWDARAAFIALASGDSLATVIQDSSQKLRLESAFQRVMQAALFLARQNHISDAAFKKLVSERARMINKAVPELYRPVQRTRNVQLIDQYRMTRNRTPIWDSIESSIATGQRSFMDLDGWQAMVRFEKNPLDGSEIAQIYDARRGEYVLRLQMAIQNGWASIKGTSISEEQVRSARLLVSSDGWATQVDVPAKETERGVVFVAPISAEGREVEFALHDPTNTFWWKAPEGNFRFSLQNREEQRQCKNAF